MTKHELLEELCELMEIDTKIDVNTNLSEMEEFDSLVIMGLIALIDEHFGIVLTGTKLAKIKNVNDLITLIGTNKVS